MSYNRYAIYYTAEGALAEAGASWLGWDVAHGQAVAQPDLSQVDIKALTDRPRRYGFHATLKPPMRLAAGTDVAALRASLEQFAEENAPAEADGLELSRMGRWLALTLRGDAGAVGGLAAAIVRHFDPFRAPAPQDELDRRRARGLSDAQEANLVQWGYPYVMEAFRFHMTLSAPSDEVTALAPLAEAHFIPVLPHPFRLDALTLAGEDDDGFFHEIARVSLTG